jgi:4-amino-4-deoxy-L-arabinose transferase-like glycosyltransferase
MFHLTKKFDRWLYSHIFLLLALLLLLFLRIPNFFEPYWYGDEGIYLTIGNAIRDGERLYADIVDHKTPIIYYLAAVPSQLSFRLLNLGWMIVTTIAFYNVGKKLFKKQLPLIVSTFVFVILTSLPWLEGNIPNGELFVMGFVLMGAWIMTKTKLFNLFIEKSQATTKLGNPFKNYLVGIFFGLAVLTKVPAILDVGALMAMVWFVMTNRLDLLKSKNTRRQWWQLFTKAGLQLLVLILGILTPILISIIYFKMIGAGQDYLQFGLLYNFHYAANWSLPFNNLILEQFFTLQGKLAIAAFIYLLLTFKNKSFKPAHQLIFGWFILSLVGALLSNRPYPHYFQQLVPSLALLLGIIIEAMRSKGKKLPTFVMSFSLLGLFAAALILLDFGAYPAWSYYQRFFKLASGQMSAIDYRHSFNGFMKDNYKASEIINQSGVNEIFIWGTNPMLYAQTGTHPTGKFTVSFHIKDLGVYQETMDSVKNEKPLFIIVMDEEGEDLPGLNEYLEKYYVLNSNFDHFSMWKRLPELVSLGTL